ncbi:magnesium transporter MRS2-I-like [Chenopodium quinoa]|uniref:magnesium transporter MRS2-I-like n=1 Tax=Chenopodium quinoa TaxID=63459 RepID=UPI000B78FAEF|nr:magnesium transporter MRS2-I-like [Chenopodium quinoa]
MGREGYVVPVDPQMGLSVGLKKKPAGSRSWILLDSPGQATVLDLDKYAIMHRVQIHARDLRILDPLLSYPSTILGREKAIVLNLEHIKAIITADEISSWNLDRVRKLKSAMTRLTARVQKVRDELEQLLDDDGDMADLYLSRKLAAPASPVSGSGANWFPSSPTVTSKVSRASRASMVTGRGDENDVEELEMLLEAYFMQIDGTLNKLTTLREYIDDTEDYINIQLDNYRNQLIQLELFLSSGTVCLSIYSLVAAIFGMNIPYTWMDNHDYIFKWVIILSGLFSAVFFVVIVAYARFKGLVGS